MTLDRSLALNHVDTLGTIVDTNKIKKIQIVRMLYSLYHFCAIFINFSPWASRGKVSLYKMGGYNLFPNFCADMCAL